MSTRAGQAALKAYPENFFISRIYATMIRGFYKEGYEQAEKDTIERACKWLESLVDGDVIVDVKAFVGAFRNEMEEGE